VNDFRVDVPVWRASHSKRVLVEVLRRGGVVAIPTESSYALAVDPKSASGVAAVGDIKKRSQPKPLPVVVGGLSQLASIGVTLPIEGLYGLEKAWPGALSILLPCVESIPAAAGTGHLAVRIPGHEALRELLLVLDWGLTATSANRAGEEPILDPAQLVPLLSGRDAIIVDGGVLPGGPPSTLVKIDGHVGRVLRFGRIPVARLRELAPRLDLDPSSAPSRLEAPLGAPR